jgi:hypothetical protein
MKNHTTKPTNMDNSLRIKDKIVLPFYKRTIKPTTMKNFTMCEGKDAGCSCPIREHCLRNQAKPDPHYQAWFVQLPFNFEKEHCECFLPVKNFKQPRPLGWLFQMN